MPPERVAFKFYISHSLVNMMNDSLNMLNLLIKQFPFAL